MIVGFNHAQITVPPGHADRVRQFYGRFLGLTELPVPTALQGRGLIWFRIGDRELHIGEESGVDRETTRAHLAYEVDDIARLRADLVEANFEIFPQPVIVGFDRFHIRDPFGNRVEFIQRVG